MVQYIYFVKCPNCEDEPFDLFDEAKDFALGCMSKKPIITQIEVCRNDFGECTDSNDLGTVWSWEDMMKETDTEPACSVFTKDDFKDFEGDYNPENDPEFTDIDNSVDFEPETSEVSAIDEVPDNFRKPIPEGMTIESLVEEMEENEDTVECKICNDLFSKEDCRYETDMGYLCPTCERAIKSRGETLTFEENLTEASLFDIVSIANNEYGTDYTEDDILDAAEVEDLGYYADLEIQNEINAEAQRNKRRRQAYAIAQAQANKNTKGQTVTEAVSKERINKMTKSELRTMIREMLHEELSLKEEIKEIINEDGIFSSLNRAVMDNLCDITICRRKGASTDSNADDYYDSDNWISTVPTNRLHGQRKEMDNGLTTRFTYLLAGGIPKDVDPTKNDKIKKGLFELRNDYPEDQYEDNRIKYEHKVYTETKGDTQDLYYSVLMIPNYKEGYQLQSRDFPSLLRGQAEGPDYWKRVAAQKR